MTLITDLNRKNSNDLCNLFLVIKDLISAAQESAISDMFIQDIRENHRRNFNIISCLGSNFIFYMLRYMAINHTKQITKPSTIQ